MAAGQVVRFPISSSGEAATDTVSPSAYSVLDKSRERFIVLAMSTLLLLISLTLFGILFTLLSQDSAPRYVALMETQIKHQITTANEH